MNNNEIDKKFIVMLTRAIEQKMNRKPHTPTDFKFISDAIGEKTKQNLSSTTLMRVWGYVKDKSKTRVTTLNIMSRFLNYPDFDAFEEYCKNQDDESQPIFSDAIISSKLELNTKIEITWNPNRRCVLQHLGQTYFEVIVSENSKMKVGDRFRCPHLIMNEPLIIFELTSGDIVIEAYEIGKRSGLTSMKILSD